MSHYAVDVTFATHDGLKRGVVERPWRGGRTWHRILISADEVTSDREAVLLAAQMATGPGMCTSAKLVSWPEERSP